MNINEVKSEKKLSFEKSSKRAAWFTLAGVLIVVASLLFSFFQLSHLNNEIDEKMTESGELDKKLDEKRLELEVKNQQLSEARTDRDEKEKDLAVVIESIPQTALKQTVDKNPEIKQIIEQVKEIKPVIKPKSTPDRPAQSNDKKIALDKEREGFQALIAGNYDRSIAAFQASENAYNSYHNVYDLARLLRKNKSQMDNPAKRKEVFQTIVKKHSYGAPSDLWQQVVSIANQ
jgi:ATP-dependent 26S proteasome regulatory subunit